MQCTARLLFLGLGISLIPIIAEADQISTTTGDQLTGQILLISQNSVIFRHAAGSKLVVSLNKVNSLSSNRPMTVTLHSGDRVTGIIELGSDGRLRIHSESLGQLSLSPDKIKTASSSFANSAPRRAEAAEFAPPPAPWAIEKPSEERLATTIETARIAGRGSLDTVAQASPTQSSPATTKSDGDEGPRTQLRFLRDETVLLGDRNIEADFVLSYLRNTVDITDDSSLLLTTSIRANLFNNLEGFVSLPVQWSQRELSQIAPQPVNTTISGIGDVRFVLRSRLLAKTASLPAIFAGISASAPTGDDPYINPRPPLAGEEPIIDIRDPFVLTPGAGHWSVTGSVSFLRSYDPIVLFAGFDYTRVFPKVYYGRKIEPGDIFGYNFGFGFGVSESSTLGALISGSFEEDWSFGGVPDANTKASPVS